MATMSERVDLYDNAYGHYEAEEYRLVRVETYGTDLGQTGWTPRKSQRKFRKGCILVRLRMSWRLGAAPDGTPSRLPVTWSAASWVWTSMLLE